MKNDEHSTQLSHAELANVIGGAAHDGKLSNGNYVLKSNAPNQTQPWLSDLVFPGFEAMSDPSRLEPGKLR